MNVHHLELFYYVATHGGISAAVRAIPYGIQQPAVSGQIGKLEQELGVKLFDRTPFRLTPAGEKLYAHVHPFFNALPGLRAQLSGGDVPELRIGGAELVLRDHLPEVMKRVREEFPKLKFSLRSTGFQSQVEEWLHGGQVDVAFAPVYAKAPAGLRTAKLAKLPLVLEVPTKSPIKSAEELWRQKIISEPLICLPHDTGIVRGFFRELKKRGVSWPALIEVTSIDLVARYAAAGNGIGLNVLVNPKARPRGVRILPLDGFAPVVMGAIWRGELSEHATAAVAGVRAYARTRWPDWVCDS
ncbi:MAG: LysR family transcriptional regulator [Opitutaceae bacterium]